MRIGIDCEHHRARREFCAYGHVEVQGNDLLASVIDADAYQAIDALVQRLDRMLWRWSTAMRRSRADDDIRTHAVAS